MGTHSWSVPPLGLLALFSAAPQVSPHSARSAFSQISIFSEYGHSFLNCPPTWSAGTFLCRASSIPPLRPQCIFPNFHFLGVFSPFSRPRRHFACFLEYPPNPPALRSPIFPGVSPHSAPPSFFLFPGVFPHSARRQFPSCLEYPPTPPTVIFPVF